MGRKLSPDSLYTVDDQLAMYREQMGNEAAERQILAAKKAKRQCTCTPRRVKIEGGYAHKETRTVHAQTCPKFKLWMQPWA